MDARELYQKLTVDTLVNVKEQLYIHNTFNPDKELTKQINYLRIEIVQKTKDVKLIEKILKESIS